LYLYCNTLSDQLRGPTLYSQTVVRTTVVYDIDTTSLAIHEASRTYDCRK